MNSNSNSKLPVVVVGAGPVGLAAAAHLLERNLDPLIVEAAPMVAHNVRDWGHVRLFSPWRYNVDPAAQRLLKTSGWTTPPPDRLPTGAELVANYLGPLAELEPIASRLKTDHRVIAVGRDGLDNTKTGGRNQAPFRVWVRHRDGTTASLTARAIIDASGTWGTPNPLGAAGMWAEGEAALAAHIHYGIPDVLGKHRARYQGKRTLVVGAGHSAANSILALLELAESAPGIEILWATRGNDLTRVFGGGDADALPARGELGQRLRHSVEQGRLTLLSQFNITSIALRDGRLDVGATCEDKATTVGADTIIAATGQRPDLGFLREVRIALDPALESAAALGPLIDPNEHSCGTVRPHGALELAHPESDLYIVGSKSYGRAPTFLLATGYEQVRSISAMLAGDVEAATRVELALPQTGVCKTEVSDSDCCVSPASACC